MDNTEDRYALVNQSYVDTELTVMPDKLASTVQWIDKLVSIPFVSFRKRDTAGFFCQYG